MCSPFSSVKKFVIFYASLQNRPVEWRDSTSFWTKVENASEAGVGVSINSDLDSILRVIFLVNQEIIRQLASDEADKRLSVSQCKGVGQCWSVFLPRDGCRNVCNVVATGDEEPQW